MNYLISSNCKEQVKFSNSKSIPQILTDDGQIRILVNGLQPGQSMPAHTEAKIIYYILEGTGEMVVEDQTIPVTQGSTIYVPQGARRGIKAETQLAFLAVRVE
jgi:quercetin dioxygenase-like cupin family protein